jgi:hypothetical protein
MSIRLPIAGALALLALSGCATVSKTECQTGDWYDIGIRDGANGYAEERFLADAKACAKHGLTADRTQWAEGRRQGLQRYCTLRNGLAVGEQRSGYAGVCPQPAEDEFLRGYSLGRDLADARARLAHETQEIHQLRERLEPPEHKDGDKQSHDEDSLSNADRIELAIRLGEATVRREQREREVAELEERAREL